MNGIYLNKSCGFLDNIFLIIREEIQKALEESRKQKLEDSLLSSTVIRLVLLVFSIFIFYGLSRIIDLKLIKEIKELVPTLATLIAIFIAVLMFCSVISYK